MKKRENLSDILKSRFLHFQKIKSSLNIPKIMSMYYTLINKNNRQCIYVKSNINVSCILGHPVHVDSGILSLNRSLFIYNLNDNIRGIGIIVNEPRIV